MNEIITRKKDTFLKNVENIFQKKYENPNALLDEKKEKIEVGDMVRISYLIPEGEKERIQIYEGLIISIKNRGIGKSFTLRRTIQGVGIEQIFVAHSPKIVSIFKKQSSKVRRAKLYFLRYLSGKATRLKRKF
jgi:large subunit ribosomal protein L19